MKPIMTVHPPVPDDHEHMWTYGDDQRICWCGAAERSWEYKDTTVWHPHLCIAERCDRCKAEQNRGER